MFRVLQHALTSVSVLKLPAFDKEFIMECDVWGSSIGVVLHKGDALVTFSRPIAPRHVNLTGYKRELIGLIQAVWHLRSYLWGRSWCVRTISFSSYFVTNTSPQFLNMSGQASSWDLILGWNTNRVPQTPLSTLSQHDPEVQAFTMALSFASFKLYDELHGEYDTDSTLASQRQEVLDGSLSD
jgi:hypothetical protein